MNNIKTTSKLYIYDAVYTPFKGYPLSAEKVILFAYNEEVACKLVLASNCIPTHSLKRLIDSEIDHIEGVANTTYATQGISGVQVAAFVTYTYKIYTDIGPLHLLKIETAQISEEMKRFFKD